MTGIAHPWLGIGRLQPQNPNCCWGVGQTCGRAWQRWSHFPPRQIGTFWEGPLRDRCHHHCNILWGRRGWRRSPGASSSVYLATFPPSICLIHLAGCHCLSLQGRLRSTSPRFSLYPGRASSKGLFVSTCCVGRLIHCRSSRASSRSPFLMACRFSTHLEVSSIASMIPLSTVGWRFGSVWMTFHANLGDRAPPRIWAKRLSWEASGPSILCIS